MKRAVATIGLAFAGAMLATGAFAQGKPDFKIGAIFDQTGPFAGGGSKAAAIGTKIAIDIINERGGVEGHKIVGVFADAQSKVDVAINEAERLLNEQKVDMITGVYSSAQCVPLAAKVDAAKKFLWMSVCVSTAVVKGKNLQYAFRPTIHSDQYGDASCSFVAENASKLGKDKKDIKVAIINEDGPYGVGVGSAAETRCKELSMQVVHHEAYSATASDLSAMVSKLRRAAPDVIIHAGYNPDITLFLRQAKEAGLKFNALIGEGAGYSQIDKLYETFKDDVNFLLDVDPAPAQLFDPKTLAPGLGDLIAEMVKRYKAETGATEVPPHTSMGFNNTWIFLTDVLPRAIKKYGGYDADALRKAALDADIPIGGTMQGYGVKFFPAGTPLAGQNERSIAVVMQFVNGKTSVVWPPQIKTADPVFPLPKGHAYAK